jgi:hypothetical protein
MSRRKTIAWLMSLTLLFAALLPCGPAHAQTGGEGDSGMVLRKTAEANGDGSYTIRLEAYATGSKIITEVTKDVPTDLILVLDQSGSMDDPIGTVSFEEYRNRSNAQHYENRHNGGNANLYYPLGDGSYASVSVALTSSTSYQEIAGSQINTQYYAYAIRGNLYARVGDAYRKVDVIAEMDWSSFRFKYTYTLDGTVIATSTDTNGIPSFGAYGPLYQLETDASQNQYAYTYTDAEGQTHEIGTSTGADTRFETTLYRRKIDGNAGDSRIDALTRALEGFTSAVQTKAAGQDGVPDTEDDVSHRIAVVGFASAANSYENTELFIGGSQYSYGDSARGQYAHAFQDMRTPGGQANVAASIAALDAKGGTHPDLGLEMANGILQDNPVGEGETRNRVVILFTDGSPGDYSFDAGVANSAIDQAGLIKGAGATVYAVGIFAGADATSAGDANGTNAEKSNWFMQNASSNDGSVRNPSYYLSAADADTLNDIFQRISEQIETGGASTELGEETVIRDLIAPAFALPEGADADSIDLETYAYTGENQWEPNPDAMGATAQVEGDQVTVTGFDFAEHYVGTVTEGGSVTYRGSKLVISFAVRPKPGFLGGNDVLTNAGAGVYENLDATEPILTFEAPAVNVPIPAITVSAQNRDLYLLGGVSAEALRAGCTADAGGAVIALDPSAENFGLEPWQTESVDLTVSILDAQDRIVAGFENLTEDETYRLSVTIAPKTDGAGADGQPAAAQTGSAMARLRVFLPELTFRDGDAYYGDAAPDDFSANLTATRWKYGQETADDARMGPAPVLALTHTVDAAKLLEGRINTKQDVGVSITAALDSRDVTAYARFVHEPCAEGCGWTDPAQGGQPAFLLHVKTCTLTVSKTGGADGEPYVFDVYRNGEKYTQLTIVGNASAAICELPVGAYVVREDGDWSWRYAAGDEAVTLTAENPEANAVCRNSMEKPYWLNGYSGVAKNLFGATE